MTGTDQTLKTYYERINIVVQYIHNHIDERLDLNYLASISCYSSFHFHRIMRAYLGESIGSYLQRTRLGIAAQLLRITDLQVSEIVLKVGYDSQASFNKVFKRRFGITPIQFRNNREFQLPFREPLKQKITMKNLTLDPEYRTINDIMVVYVIAIGAYGDQNTENAWKTVCGFAGKNQLLRPDTQYIGISFDDPSITEPEKCRYEACVTVKKIVKPEGLVGFKILKGGKFAVFKLNGPYTLLAPSYQYIYGEWAPRTNVQLRDEPSFEKYLNTADKTTETKLQTEIWVPVI